MNAVVHRLDAAGDGVVGVVEIHEVPPKAEWRKFSRGEGFCLVECERRGITHL